MRKITRSHRHLGLTLLCVILLATGCQARKGPSPDADFTVHSGKSYSSSSTQGKADNLLIQEEWEDRALELVLDTAHVAKGTPYVYGGATLSGFDCSGLVRWAYNAVGVKLPRSAREQSQFGEKVSRDDLRVGDIVAFRHPRRGYHTGIYMGNGKFIHSPRRRDVVKVSSLTDAYYRDTYLGARRPDLPDSVDLQEVEQNLASIKAQKRAIETVMLSKKMRNDANPAAKLKAKKNSKATSQKARAQKATSQKASSQKANSQKASPQKANQQKASPQKASPQKSGAKNKAANTAQKPESKRTMAKQAPAKPASKANSKTMVSKANAKPASKAVTQRAPNKQTSSQKNRDKQIAARDDKSSR